MKYWLSYLMVLIFILCFICINFTSSGDFLDRYALIPVNISEHGVSRYFTFITALFVHIGVSHLASNSIMFFLIGKELERLKGKLFLVFCFLLGGVVAFVGQYIFQMNEYIFIIGASGAISAMAGSYIVLCNRQTVSFFIPGLGLVYLPVQIMISVWIIFEIWRFVDVSVGVEVFDSTVAFVSHIVGFNFGIFLGYLFRSSSTGYSKTKRL